MESISIFDIFKIGVGPSSSHTLGPWKAATSFIDNLNVDNLETIQVQLYGSLSKTGVGHATDIAVLLGLLGFDPELIDTNEIESIVQKAKEDGEIKVKSKTISFNFQNDIIFENSAHPFHPNTLKITALNKAEVIKEELYASIGGGFIKTQNEKRNPDDHIKLPFPINKGVDLLCYTKKQGLSISDIVQRNECAIRTAQEIETRIDKILDTILESLYKGCRTGGILPGGLYVVRRAKKISEKLLNGQSYDNREAWLEAIKEFPKTFNCVNKWVSCFALAVNEQNAAMGRIVTSPTNGAAGVIPAVMMYYMIFCNYQDKASLRKFLFTAGEVGSLFKKGATISAAVGGCQAEIGVSSAMAAAGLTEVLGGTPEQCLMAAEIAMQHHLGLTCDPVMGLVQVPCIERNAMGAIKAITAANLALESDPKDSKVPLDAVIKTMWEVATNMNNKYKETSEGGLAINLPVVNPSC